MSASPPWQPFQGSRQSLTKAPVVRELNEFSTGQVKRAVTHTRSGAHSSPFKITVEGYLVQDFLKWQVKLRGVIVNADGFSLLL